MCHPSCIEFVRANLYEMEVRGKSVVEVGSRDVNGSVRPLVEPFSPCSYIGVDIESGPGVDLICDAGALVDRFGTEAFDLLICTEVLEHVQDWRDAIANFKRVLKPHGTLMITTRSKGFPYHGHPYDFWRYEISDMRTIFSDFAIEVLEPDPMMPGVFLKARKPCEHSENDLTQWQLYSIPPNDTDISACIVARDECSRIEAALRSLQGWTNQIIVVDCTNEADAVAIAQRYTNCIITVPRTFSFNACRNLAAEIATGGWVFYLEANEEVPARLGAVLRRLVADQGEQFEALCLPCQHHFCEQWMRRGGRWPGYGQPQLLKKGRFRFDDRHPQGLMVEGRTVRFPADDPELALVQHSASSLDNFLRKLSSDIEAEAESLYAQGAPHSWQAQFGQFVHDWQRSYEQGFAHRDGMHGFVLALLSAFARLAARAELWDLRRQRGELNGREVLPTSLDEVLEFMASVMRSARNGEAAVAAERSKTTDQGVNTAIVVPVHNALEHTRECLNSIVSTYPRVPLIVVDDCSNDETHEWLSRFLFEVCPGQEAGHRVLLRNARQQLFTRSVNRGIRWAYQMGQLQNLASVDFVAIVNSDCYVCDKWLESLWLGMQDPQVGIVGFPHWPDGMDPLYREATIPAFVTGHCLLLRMSMLEHIGVFCETDLGGGAEIHSSSPWGQAHYGSDRMLSWRANRSGWKTLYCHRMLCDHVGQGSAAEDPNWLASFDLQPLWPPCDGLLNPAWVEGGATRCAQQ